MPGMINADGGIIITSLHNKPVSLPRTVRTQIGVLATANQLEQSKRHTAGQN